MGTYWYIDDPDSDGGVTPVFEDDYIAALLGIAKSNGIKITDKMILKEVKQKEIQKHES